MKLTHGIKLACLSLAISGLTMTTAQAELDGKALYADNAKACITCHGKEGKKPILPTYPKLNGQNKEYLAAQMKMIRDGVRTGGLTIAMKMITASLKDDEIEAIAKYLSEVE